MIICRTPFRISFLGGGSDLPDYYTKHGPGAVISTTINKYIYLTVHPFFAESKILLKYSQHELVDSRDQIKHEIIRAVFDHFEISGVDLSSSADLPSGTGMASSSAFTSGLINLCAAFKGLYMSKAEIAKLACHIEIDLLKEPIGRQDQYACSIGGFNLIEFHSNDDVTVERLHLANGVKESIRNNLLLFYLGKTRKASSILAEQKSNMQQNKKTETLQKMVSRVYDLKRYLLGSNVNMLGELLHEGWLLKKELASGISTPAIDEYYNIALKAGAVGGKLLGAGGGGFLLLYVLPTNRQSVINALSNLTVTDVEFENTGTSIIF